MLIDLSVPRGAHADVSEIPELLVLGLDDLDAVVARHHRERRGEVTHAERILVEEVHKHLALNAYATLKPVVAGMQERFERACEQVLAAHGDLYHRSRDGWPTLTVRRGRVSLASLQQAPLGVGFEVDVEQFTSSARWRVDG